jgi:hypothetical protein
MLSNNSETNSKFTTPRTAKMSTDRLDRYHLELLNDRWEKAAILANKLMSDNIGIMDKLLIETKEREMIERMDMAKRNRMVVGEYSISMKEKNDAQLKSIKHHKQNAMYINASIMTLRGERDDLLRERKRRTRGDLSMFYE